MSKASEYAKRAAVDRPRLDLGGIRVEVTTDGICEISSQVFGFKFPPADALRVADFIRDQFGEGKT